MVLRNAIRSLETTGLKTAENASGENLPIACKDRGAGGLRI
jgi:hypothetical protein